MAHLLLVDDETDLLEGLYIVLTEAGHEVQTVTSGEAALSVLRKSEGYVPALIVTDMVMLGINGLQLMEAVHASTAYAHIPFLFISASLTEEMEKKLKGADNAILLRKPFEIRVLCETVNKILLRRAS
jgi:two-component system response regulator GlrR